MAIKLNTTHISGAKADYHRISEAAIDFNTSEAQIVVLSYMETSKRNEEKDLKKYIKEQEALREQLDELMKDATPENEEERIELSQKINDSPEVSPESTGPRNIFKTVYTIQLPEGQDFSLAFAYNWLKENIYPGAKDC